MKNSLIHRAGVAPPPGGHDTKQPLGKQVHYPVERFWWVAVVLLYLALHHPAGAAPTAAEILASAREQVGRQQVEVKGRLRENETIVPFRLTQTGPVVRYSFTDPDESLQLRLGNAGSQLEEITQEGVDKIAGAEFNQKVRGTAITYEDLALKFIYWPNAQLVGEDYINTRRVWKLELRPPGRESQYSRVFLWCEQQSGALMRMQGFDWNGKIVKRFEVVSVQKIEGRYFLKQMRIEALAPEDGRVKTRTYLEITK